MYFRTIIRWVLVACSFVAWGVTAICTIPLEDKGSETEETIENEAIWVGIFGLIATLLMAAAAMTRVPQNTKCANRARR